MMKLIVRVALLLVALLVVVVGASLYFLGSIVERGIETVGPQITKTDVTLDGATLSLLSGSGTLSGLYVGNPQGFKTEAAIKVGSISVDVAPGSVFADKIHVKGVRILAPEITFEGGLGASNLSKLQDNVQATAGGSGKAGAAPPNGAASQKLQVDDLLISDGQIKLSIDIGPLGGKSATVPLPEIHLTNLGGGPDGVTAGELTSRVLNEVLREAIKASGKAVADLGRGAAGLAGDAGKTATEGVENATKSLAGLLRKK